MYFKIKAFTCAAKEPKKVSNNKINDKMNKLAQLKTAVENLTRANEKFSKKSQEYNLDHEEIIPTINE